MNRLASLMARFFHHLCHPIKFLDSVFHPPPPPYAEVVAESLALARHMLEQQTQTREYHEAMSWMYQRRIERLQAVQEVAA